MSHKLSPTIIEKVYRLKGLGVSNAEIGRQLKPVRSRERIRQLLEFYNPDGTPREIVEKDS